MWTHAVFERPPMATAAEGRLNDHWRHRIIRVFGDWTRAGLARPAAIVGRRRRRQRPIRRRLQSLPPFVITRGGEYCFAPGLRALRWLAQMDIQNG